MNHSTVVSALKTTGLFLTGSLAGTIMTSYITQKINQDDEFFNITESKYSFGEEYTKSIDSMLMKDDFSQVSCIIYELGEKVPGFGTHYYYPFMKTKQSFLQKYLNCIRFIKRREIVGDKLVVSYQCYVGFFNSKTYEIVMRHLSSIDPDLIQTISIDTSSHMPKLIYAKKLCSLAHPRQVIALDHICELYNEGKNHNVKTIIYGNRGTGKTYIGRLLKKRLEQDGLIPYLFDDFNPASVGVNIQWLALNQASQKTPVILVIDEINTVYDEVTKEKQEFDSRLQYTKNIQSFNNMLDLFGDTKYVIVIFTTELSIEQLKERKDHKSFFRHGRVDFFLKMTKDNCSLEENFI
jgi:hypothetical protein